MISFLKLHRIHNNGAFEEKKRCAQTAKKVGSKMEKIRGADKAAKIT